MKYTILLFILIFALTYEITYQKNQHISDQYTTVLFMNQNKEIIPVSIPYSNNKDIELDIKNKLNIMKSKDYISYGFYPILTKDIILNITDKTINIEYNDPSLSNIHLLETFTNLLNNYKYNLKLNINNKTYTYTNTYIPLNSLTDYSTTITTSTPVTIYKKQTINNKQYYIPISIRINKDTLENETKEILNYLDPSIDIKQIQYKNNILHIYLSPHILLENEQIEKTLEERIYLSLRSYKDFKDIKIYINNEEITTSSNKEIIINYIDI